MQLVRLARLLIPIATTTAVALADSAGPPLGPVDRSIVKEEPCDADAPLGDAAPLIGRYMCQIGLDGAWFQPYPCEIIRSTSTSGYLRYAKWNIPCEVVATIGNKKLGFDGSMGCDPIEQNVIGVESIVNGKLAAIPGGFRLEKKIELAKTTAFGPDSDIPRRTRVTTTKPKFALNICRKAWPKGFVSDIVRAEAMERGRRGS